MNYKGLIVGLGNPGGKYLLTRHNFGFMCVDRILNRYNCDTLSGSKFKAELYSCKFGADSNFILAKAQTFMNLTGESIQPLSAYYKIEPENIYVIHDELDLDFGVYKFKFGGGNAGHNGLKSMSERLGTNDFYRLRMGIGRPFDRTNSISWVLSNFGTEERNDLVEILDLAIDELELYACHGAEEAKKIINIKKSQENNKPKAC